MGFYKWIQSEEEMYRELKELGYETNKEIFQFHLVLPMKLPV